MAEFGLGQEIVPGGLDAVKNALNRRRLGDPASSLSQVGGASPTPNNIGLQGPPTSPTPPTGPPAPGGLPQAAGGLPTPETPQNQIMNREVEIILKAMSTRLGAISKNEQAQSQPPQANIPPNLLGV